MKINRKLNTLSHNEFIYATENHKKFTDFNTLGLFRSILENSKLSLDQKIECRNLAIAAFRKTFEFLQLKDLSVYFELNSLGKELNVADKSKAWDDIRSNQQRIINDKKLNHRNFGTYLKHECGYATCHLNGIMIRSGSTLAYNEMGFCSDKSKYAAQNKSEIRKQDRKSKKRFIVDALDSE